MADSYQFNGLDGQKYSDVAGWNNTTVGAGGNMKIRLGSQQGVQPTDPNVLAAREPFRNGIFIVKWLRTPPFFHPKMSQLLQVLFEDGAREVSGVPNNAIDAIENKHGTVQRTEFAPGFYKQSAAGPTIKVAEYAGSPVRKMLDYWLGGMSDRKTAIAHMYGRTDLRSMTTNMSGALIYILLGPSARPEDIEYACMWENVFPTNETKDHLNSGSIGDGGGNVELSVEFKGVFDEGPHVDKLARLVTEGYGLYEESFMDARLPAYVYRDYFGKEKEQLKEMFGVNMNVRMSDEAAKAVYTDEVQDIANTQDEDIKKTAEG